MVCWSLDHPVMIMINTWKICSKCKIVGVLVELMTTPVFWLVFSLKSSGLVMISQSQILLKGLIIYNA